MPQTTLLEMSQQEQAQMLAALRRARYGYLLALPVLLLCAAGRNPSEIAPYLFCSRSSVYRIVRAYRQGTLGLRVEQDGHLCVPVRTTVLMPWLPRSLGAFQSRPTYLWLVPHTLELCHTRRDSRSQNRPPGIGRNHATLAP